MGFVRSRFGVTQTSHTHATATGLAPNWPAQGPHSPTQLPRLTITALTSKMHTLHTLSVTGTPVAASRRLGAPTPLVANTHRGEWWLVCAAGCCHSLLLLCC